MRSINRIFTLFVVLAAFASARSFGSEFTPMPTLFDSVGVQQTSNSSTQDVLPIVQPLPSSPEDIQFPEPTNDVDLTLIPAPEEGSRQETVGSSNSPEANSAPAPAPLATRNSQLASGEAPLPNRAPAREAGIAPDGRFAPLATRNSQLATSSIEQVGFYLPEQTAIPAIPRSTLPDPSINNPDYNFQLKRKPAPVNPKAIAAAPQLTYVPEDVKAIVETPVTTPVAPPVTTPVANPFAQESAVKNVGGVKDAKTRQVTLPEAVPVVEGSNPQMFREDFDYQQFRSEMLGEIDKRAWTTGDFQVIPYAKLWASVSYETKPTQIGSAPFFVTQPSNTGRQAHVDYRGTILGFNMKAKKLSLWEGSKVMGKVEFDLQRTIDFDNKTTVHLRHCYIEAVSEDARLLLGQTWDVVSPLAPGTLMYSAGWMDGNVGYRRAQFRLERYLNVSPCFQWKLQGCISAPFAGDSNGLLGADYRLKYGSWPIVQARVSAVMGYRQCPQKPMEIGIAGHIGELQYGQKVEGAEDTNHFAKTWGIYLDAYVPITCWFGVQGELFKGENMAMFLGGINQGVMRSVDDTPESIAAQGGWINLWFNLNPCTQLRVGYMIDDPQGRIDEIAPGSALQARTLNHSLFANIKHDITKLWWIGLEYSHVETGWTGKETGVSVCDRVDFVSYFSF